MKKNISAVLLTLACFSALSAAAFADGPIGRAIDGIGRAGRDIADGAGDAVSDVVDGADDAMSDAAGGDTSGDDTTGSDTTGSDTTSGADSDASDTSDTTSSDDSAVSSDPESSESDAASVDSNSGAVGGITATNPGTGVTYGLTAGAAVLAAVGVVAAVARKDK